MATLKQLKAQAKKAGITGFSKMNKSALEKALGGSGSAPASKSGGPVGVPTEAKRGGVTDAEIAAAQEASKASGTSTPDAKIGVPTEPERGGVTDKDLGKFPEPDEPAKPGPRPSLTGQTNGIGVPTEPKRGGINKLEKELSG